jgi:hypothetical protein
LKYQKHPKQMRIDFTLTLPGLSEIITVEDLSLELKTKLLVKNIFAFSPDIIMSPLALPRTLLEDTVTVLLDNANTSTVRDFLHQLLLQPTFEERWPDQYKQAIIRGKQRVLRLESIRKCDTNMETILKQWPNILKWWQQID